MRAPPFCSFDRALDPPVERRASCGGASIRGGGRWRCCSAVLAPRGRCAMFNAHKYLLALITVNFHFRAGVRGTRSRKDEFNTQLACLNARGHMFFRGSRHGPRPRQASQTWSTARYPPSSCRQDCVCTSKRGHRHSLQVPILGACSARGKLPLIGSPASSHVAAQSNTPVAQVLTTLCMVQAGVVPEQRQAAAKAAQTNVGAMSAGTQARNSASQKPSATRWSGVWLGFPLLPKQTVARPPNQNTV
jgi:hypothetical protein